MIGKHFLIPHQLKHPMNCAQLDLIRRKYKDEFTAVKPAISIQVRTAGTRDAGLYKSQSQSKRASGTNTRASSGFIVA